MYFTTFIFINVFDNYERYDNKMCKCKKKNELILCCLHTKQYFRS